MAALAAAPRCQPLHERPRAAAASGSLRLCSKGPANVALAGRSALRRQQLQSAPRTAAAEAAVADDGASQARASQLVDQVLEAIRDTDGGDRVSPAMRQQVDGWLQELGAIGDARAQRPLQDPNIFGNYEVAYVSMGKAQYGQPAGGRFRGGLGKLLFRTTLLAQSVLQPDVVTNKVAFRLLGLIPGSVGLRGSFVSCPDREGGEDRKDTVKVFFEPPVLSLPGGVHIRIGPPSSVVLKTTYVDERVRLGLGSRGSYFVFTRGGAADAAGMDQVGLEQCSTIGKVVLFGIVGALMLNGAWLAAQPALPPVIRAAGVVQVLLGTALGGVCYRGGIVSDNEDRPEVVKDATSQQGGDAAATAAST
ncbi:hypothetical protein ABPG77_009047 [Micractinium sp. CCAP 211/92]